MNISVAATDEKNRKVLELAKQRFEAKHRGCLVELEMLPKEIVEQRIREGNSPDIIEWDGIHIGRLLDRNVVIDLAPMLKEAAFDLSDFYPPALHAATDKGRIGAVPVMAEVPGVFYNKAQFDQAGIAYPKDGWTWEEFVKKARKLNIYNGDGDVLRYGAYVVPRLLPVEPLAWSCGGAFLSEDGTKAVGYLDSPATVEAIRKYIELFYPLEVTPFQDVGKETWISCFIHHKMAMYFDANWTIKPMRPEHREQFGVVMPPRMGDGPYRSIVQVYGYGISSKTADIDLAWAFLQELTSPHTETGREWAKYNLAVTRSLAVSSGQAADPLYSPFIKQLNDAKLGAFDVSSLKLWEFWNNDIFQDWIARGGRVNLEERLSRIAREYEDSLQKQ